MPVRVQVPSEARNNQSKGNKLCNEQHLSSPLKTETVKSYKTKARCKNA